MSVLLTTPIAVDKNPETHRLHLLVDVACRPEPFYLPVPLRHERLSQIPDAVAVNFQERYDDSNLFFLLSSTGSAIHTDNGTGVREVGLVIQVQVFAKRFLRG